MELVKRESELKSLFEILYSDTLSAPGSVIEQILGVMPEALLAEGAMEFPWSRLPRQGSSESSP